jgi:homoserine O-acetyltransferase
VADVSTQFITFKEPFRLRSGEELPEATMAFETWGELNEDASNAIVVFHALSGSHHLAGFNPAIPGVDDLWQPEMQEGWWNDFVAPGKAFDTDRYFVICANYLGGCYGSTGPSSIDPRTGEPYGATFPHVTAADQVDFIGRLLDHFGIRTLHAVVGPSVGGLVALSLATLRPERVRHVISIASGFKTTVLNRLILFEQILAIENDPYFHGGNYYGKGRPDYGLALARMISHKTFVHIDAFERRARREVIPENEMLAWYDVRDQFQSYMLGQGKKFVKRFDANTYLRIIDMWSHYNAIAEAGVPDLSSLFGACREAGQKWLIFSIDSDFCFYPEEQLELAGYLTEAEIDNTHITVHSDKGHDSFLLEPHLYTPHIDWMLGRDADT